MITEVYSHEYSWGLTLLRVPLLNLTYSQSYSTAEGGGIVPLSPGCCIPNRGALEKFLINKNSDFIFRSYIHVYPPSTFVKDEFVKGKNSSSPALGLSYTGKVVLFTPTIPPPTCHKVYFCSLGWKGT